MPRDRSENRFNGSRELFAKRVKEIRERKGLSQSELAKQSKIARTRIVEIEGNKHTPTLSTVDMIAHALHVPVLTLFIDENA